MVLYLFTQNNAMKTELQQNLTKVNNMISYSPELYSEYKSIVATSIALIKNIDPEGKGAVLNAWIPMAIEELEKELAKLADTFPNLAPDRQRTEFMYSKSSVSLSLTNIVMNL